MNNVETPHPWKCKTRPMKNHSPLAHMGVIHFVFCHGEGFHGG
jgi:hypothetical protein